jgi:hypothetical protein
MPYRSPVGDILFSLNAVADLPGMIRQGLAGDLDWDAVSAIVAEAGRFATEEIAPLNRPGDLAGARYENGDGRRRAGTASPRRPSSAAWACPISSMSPAQKSGTARRWPSLCARY